MTNACLTTFLSRRPCGMDCVSPMNHRRFAVLTCAVTFAGCASVPSVPAYDIDYLGRSFVRTICGNGPPADVETIPNKHVDAVMDTIERRTCFRGSSTLYVSTQASDPSGLAMSVEIRQPGSGVPKFLEVGKSVSDATHRLGQPTSQNGDSITYEFGDFLDTFTITAPDGIIHSLAWSWSID